MTASPIWWSAITITMMLPSLDDPRPKVVEVRNEVEGRPMILMLVPNGSQVKQGDIICELDTAGLRDTLLESEIRMKQAEADAEIARKAVEVSDLGQAETREVMDQEVATAKNRIKLLSLDLKICNETLANQATLDRTDTGRVQVAEARYKQPLLKAALAKAELALKVLVEVTHPKRMLTAESERNRAASDLRAKTAILEIERGRVEKLRTMIEKSKIVAPVSGVAVHANPDDPRPNDVWIEEGALLRERQIILRIFPR